VEKNEARAAHSNRENVSKLLPTRVIFGCSCTAITFWEKSQYGLAFLTYHLMKDVRQAVATTKKWTQITVMHSFVLITILFC